MTDFASRYIIQEGVVQPAVHPDASLPDAVRDLFDPGHCRAVREYLKEELGSEVCEVFRYGILLQTTSGRATTLVASIPLVRIFDEFDLGSTAGSPSRLHHVLDVTDDALGLIRTRHGETLWFHRS